MSRLLIGASRGAVLQDATGKECGLHSGNVVQSEGEQAKEEQRDLWQGGAVEALSKEQLQGMMDGHRDKNTMLVMYAPWCQYSQVMNPINDRTTCIESEAAGNACFVV